MHSGYEDLRHRWHRRWDWGLRTAAPIGAEDARQFLLETLQLVAEKQGNSQQIYPVWAQQQVRFNEELLAAMPTVIAQLFQQNVEQQTSIAADLVNLGNLINQFPLGTRWLNLELGIAAYEQALTVRTQSALPVEWAQTTNNLAIAQLSTRTQISKFFKNSEI